MYFKKNSVDLLYGIIYLFNARHYHVLKSDYGGSSYKESFTIFLFPSIRAPFEPVPAPSM
jgi:hypothetical protein